MLEEVMKLVTENTLEMIMSTMWACFAIYAAWYFTSAKNYAPLTFAEARFLWRVHKKNTHCSSEKWREIRRGDNIIGFKCKCGYKHIQKRLITANTPALKMRPQSPLYRRLHKPA